MLRRFRVLKPFRKPKVDHVASLSFGLQSHQEVIGLHVSVDEIVVLHELDSCDHLVSQHADSFKCKLSAAVLE